MKKLICVFLLSVGLQGTVLVGQKPSLYFHIREMISEYSKETKKETLVDFEKRIIKETEKFLKSGTKVDERSGIAKETLLHLGTKNFLVDYVKYLLSKGASTEARTEDGRRPEDLLDFFVESPTAVGLGLSSDKRRADLGRIFKMHEEKKRKPQKRLLLGTILLDDDLEDLNEFKERGELQSIAGLLNLALEGKAGCIIVGGSVIQTVLREKKKKARDFLDRLYKDFDVYRHADKKAYLFLLVSHRYQKNTLRRVEDCWRKSKNKVLSKEEYALGLHIDNKDIVEKLTKEQLKDFCENEKVEVSRSLDALKTMFVKNSETECGGRWIFFEAGHGGSSGLKEGRISSLSVEDYTEQLRFFEKELSVHFLYNFTCFGGGARLILPYVNREGIRFDKTSFFIMHAGSADTSLTFPELSPHIKIEVFEHFFDFVEDISQGAMSRLRGLYERNLWFVKEPYYSFISTVPFVRFPGMKKFVPINPWKDSVEYLSFAETEEHNFVKKPFEVDSNKRLMLISPPVVPVSLKLKDPESLPIVPSGQGECVNFLKEFDITSKKIDPIKFFQNSFMGYMRKFPFAAQKMIFMKKMLIKPLIDKKSIFPVRPSIGSDTLTLDNVAVFFPTKSVSDGRVFFTVDKKSYVIIFPALIEKKVEIKTYERNDLWEDLNKRFSSVEKIPQRFMLPVQKELLLLKNIGRLVRANLWLDYISPFDFIWGKVGFAFLSDELKRIFEKKLKDPRLRY